MMCESRADFYRRKVAEGVDHRRLFAGLVGSIALGSEYAPSLAVDKMTEIRELVAAYDEIEDKYVRSLLGEDD